MTTATSSHNGLCTLARVIGLAGVAALTGCAPPTIEQVERPPLVYPEPPDEARFIHERSVRSSIDIVVDDEESRLMRYMTGAKRAGEGFTKPFAVAVHEDVMWVSDPGSRSVKRIDSSTRSYTTIGLTEPGLLRRPYDLDTDNQGRVYVIDGTLKTISIFDKQGKFLKSIGSTDDFEFPSYLAVSPDGSRVYAVDTGGVSSNKHEVMVYDTESGEILYKFGKRGNGPGDLNLPKDIEVSPDGKLYVVDSGNFRVNIYEEDGTFTGSFGQIGLKWGSFSRPKSVAIDGEGRCYVTDAAFGNFQIFTPTGELLLFIGERNSIGDRGQFFLPSGIDIDTDGRVYVVDQYHRKVEMFRPAYLPENDGRFTLSNTPPTEGGR